MNEFYNSSSHSCAIIVLCLVGGETMVYYILNSLTIKLILLSSFAVFAYTICDKHMSYRHKILGSAFFSFVVIIGFGDTFSLNATFNEIVLFGNYVFGLALIISCFSLSFAPSKKYHMVNYYLPFVGLLVMNQFEGIYRPYLGMPIPITMLVVSMSIGIFLLYQSDMNHSWKHVSLIFIGMLTTSFKSIDEFLFLGNVFYVAGSFGLMLGFRTFSQKNYEMQLEEVVALREDFEYEVKKQAAERTFYMEIQKKKLLKRQGLIT